jgi:hypothetical protein
MALPEKTGKCQAWDGRESGKDPALTVHRHALPSRGTHFQPPDQVRAYRRTIVFSEDPVVTPRGGFEVSLKFALGKCSINIKEDAVDFPAIWNLPRP